MDGMKSQCEKVFGMCLGDAACPDRLCPGHPARHCATCMGGPCETPQVCRLWVLQREPTAAEIWSYAMESMLWIATAAFILGGVGLYFDLF